MDDECVCRYAQVLCGQAADHPPPPACPPGRLPRPHDHQAPQNLYPHGKLVHHHTKYTALSQRYLIFRDIT